MGLGDKLKSLFTGGRRAMTPPEFQKKIIQIVNAEFPELKIQPGSDSHTIKSADYEFGLQNLYARYLRSGASVDLNAIVQEHFSHLLSNARQLLEANVPSWELVQQRLMPQFMPLEYETRIPVLAFPFHSELAIGIVINDERSYSYVRRDFLEKWGRSAEEIYQQSLQNLYSASSGIEVHSSGHPDRYMGIEAKDGYDAVRLLIPELRSKAVEALGEPFLAGIPNRDFLIMWAVDCTQNFHDYAYEKVKNDYEMQPYPLTPSVFQVTRTLIEPSRNFN